jgi:hypothetical protein
MTDNYYNQGQDFQDDRLTYSQRNPSMGNFEDQQRFAPQAQQRNQTDRISPSRQPPNMMQAAPQQQMGAPPQVQQRQAPVAQQQQYAQPPQQQVAAQQYQAPV